jgi:hypothetical protein
MFFFELGVLYFGVIYDRGSVTISIPDHDAYLGFRGVRLAMLLRQGGLHRGNMYSLEAL